MLDAHTTYEALRAMHRRAESALVERVEVAGNFAYLRSEVDGGPGVWETADVVRTLTWNALTDEVPADALARWMVQAANGDGGYPPSPDVSSRASYTESTARCLLSLLRLQQAAPSVRPELRAAAVAAAKWLLDCQRGADGGWGSSAGWSARTSPTVWALLALGEMDRLGTKEDETARSEALERGVSWLRQSENPDGGFGLRPGGASNVCSTSQAAWALGFRSAVISDGHHQRLIEFLGAESVEDAIDAIDEDPARKLFGRFELLLLAKPLGVLGLMACRVDLRHQLLHRLVGEIQEEIGTDGLWRIPDGRGVWPTHFYLWAIRTWIAVYESYARAGLTADAGLTTLGQPAPESQTGGHVFLSHASANKSFVRLMARILEAAGWDTWFDERALVAGDDLVGGIGAGIKESRAVVLVITEDFDGNDRWIGHEVSLAVKQQIEGTRPTQIIPVVMSGALDRVPEKVSHLVWKRAEGDAEAIALVLEALARQDQ